MATKPKAKSNSVDPRVQYCYDRIKPLYDEYSGEEITEAHRIIRREINERELRERLEWEVAQAQAALNNLSHTEEQNERE